MKTILITGANGGIGSKICDFFHKKNTIVYKLVKKDNREEKKTYTFKTIKKLKKKIDLIIHLAGYNPLPYLKVKSEREVYKRNIEIHRKTLKLIKTNNIKKIIFFSTFSLYQKDKIINENTMISANDYYTKSKLWMEKKLIHENLSCYILRSSAIIFKGSKNNWISEVISKVSSNKKIVLYNKQNKYNNCLHLCDLKKIIFKIKDKKKREKKIYNISSNKPLKIIEIKNIIKRNKAYTNKIIFKKNLKIKSFLNESNKIQKELKIKFRSTKDAITSVLSTNKTYNNIKK